MLAATMILMPFYLKNNRGSMFLTIILTVAIMVGGFMIYYYYVRLGSLEPPPIPLVTKTPTPQAIQETANWRQYKNPDYKLTLKFPNAWYLSEDNKYISQFPFDAKRVKETSIYNDFYIIRNSQQLQSGYTNYEWLEAIANLKEGQRLTNEFRPATNLQIAKISDGRIVSGQKYVLFKNTAFEEGLIAAFEKNEYVYLLVLRHYNDEGQETFQKIVNTVKVE